MPAVEGNIQGQTQNSDRKIASGRHTVVAASDIIDTGLRKCETIVVSLETNPADASIVVSGVPGLTDGTATLKSWKTDGSDPTPAAATSFGQVVNWIATGF